MKKSIEAYKFDSIPNSLKNEAENILNEYKINYETIDFNNTNVSLIISFMAEKAIAVLCGELVSEKLFQVSKAGFPGCNKNSIDSVFQKIISLMQNGDSIEFLTTSDDHHLDFNNAIESIDYRIRAEKILIKKDLTNFLPVKFPAITSRSIKHFDRSVFLKQLGYAIESDPFEDSGTTDPEKEYEELKQNAGNQFKIDDWRLYLIENDIVGFSCPSCFPGQIEEGTVLNIGVSPEFRGKGIGTIIHKLSLERLFNLGVKIYYGSTDVRNNAMVEIFKQNECPVLCHRYFYKKDCLL